MTREFAYRAYGQDGQIVQGRLKALDGSELLEKLASQGLTPFASSELLPSIWTREIRLRRILSAEELCVLFRDVTTLLEAALPIDHALRLAAAQTGSARRKAVLHDLHERMVGGSLLADAMAARPDVFSRDKIAAVRAGEMTGDLAGVLRDLCVGLERELDLRGRVASAFIYPGILVCVALFALALVLLVMVPALAPLFQDEATPMPIVLRIATAAIALFERYGLALSSFCAAGLVGAVLASRTDRFRDRRDRLALAAPIVGPLVRMAATARLARTLGALLRSGAPVPKALAVTADAASNRCVRAALHEAAERLKAGERLAEILAGLDVLSEGSRSLLLVGEKTNRLAEMLVRVAEMSEKDLGRRIERLIAVLTPVLTIAIGVLVGGLVVSVMTAILGANDLAF